MALLSPPRSRARFALRRRHTEASANVRWQREVPAAIRALDTLANPNYADVVIATVSSMPNLTPEQWVRATLDRVPRGLRLALPFVQRMFLGLRLPLRPSPDHLLGWRIVERGESWLRIEAASWFLTGHVVFHAADNRVSFASFVRYDRPLAALVWPPVSLIHRQVALALMRSGARIH